MKRSAMALLLTLLFMVHPLATLASSEDAVFSNAFKANIKSRVDKGVLTGIVIGVVTPQGTSFYSCGVKSLETMEPVDENTVFEIGSTTKTFTGVLLADEVVHGRLSLDTPVQELLPEGITVPTRNGQSIKLVHLANHTSSLPRLPGDFTQTNPENPYADLTAEQMYRFLDSYELPYDIGTKAVYSNFGMGLLGNVLAAKNKTTYEDLVIQKIATPLGMANTRIVLTPEMEANLAKGHRFGTEVSNYDLPAIAGAGALRSTAVDMLKYLAANSGLKKSELLPAMQLSHKYSGSDLGEMSVGLAWITMTVEGEEIIWHNGGTGGYMSFMGFLKGGKKGVVVLTNSSSMPDDIGIHLLNPKSALITPKPSIATKISQVIARDGADAAAIAYADLNSNHADEIDFSESQLNGLGYRYLSKGRLEEAIAVFRLNVEAFPDSWNAFDSYGEALLKNNENEKAIENYRKSIELNPENHAGIEVLKGLGCGVGE
jgi:CubicO group peptidase (beta-lactamase class C family)